ncbi:hypothetical protein P8C59_000851 [Phyllachora maydis]|uniref:Uncharacterized protein n=1 Tax=Phyllachora maydis TaxID=1825666 RepID=A0AAD9HXA1_9PEZI|nr:hypothetical protein P8C59_000851 [Phyllachora maydis]
MTPSVPDSPFEPSDGETRLSFEYIARMYRYPGVFDVRLPDGPGGNLDTDSSLTDTWPAFPLWLQRLDFTIAWEAEYRDPATQGLFSSCK